MPRLRLPLLAALAVLFAACAAPSGPALEPAAPPPPLARSFAGFWEAVLALDFEAAAARVTKPEERAYLDALRAIAGGDVERGQDALSRLVALHDPAASPRARLLLASVVKETRAIPDNAFASRVDRSFAEALQMAKARERRRLVAATVPLSWGASGTPLVPARVNGTAASLGLDTGSGLTVIGSDLANAIGARRTGARIAARDAHGEGVHAELAVVDVAIGDLLLQGHPVMVMDSARLRFRVAGERLAVFDGVLGWNALSVLRVVIDNPAARVTFEPAQPRASRSEPGDFFWVGEPYVRVRAASGLPLTLFLDTGASRSAIALPLAAAAGLRGGVTRESTVAGAGSTRAMAVTTFADTALYVSGTRIRFDEFQAVAPRDTGYAVRDGVLGADALRAGRIALDFPAREVSFMPASAR